MTKFFSLLATCLIIFASTVSHAVERYLFSPEMDAHNFLMFQVDHQGFSTSIGFFQDFEGVITLDQENLENSSVEVTVDLASVDLAGHDLWNKNTRERFFNLPKFPTMTYSSTEVKDLGDGKLEITGDINLMGITRPLVLDAKLNKVGPYMGGAKKAGFSAKASLSRKDFGITTTPPIGDHIDITIEIEAFIEGAEH